MEQRAKPGCSAHLGGEGCGPLASGALYTYSQHSQGPGETHVILLISWRQKFNLKRVTDLLKSLPLLFQLPLAGLWQTPCSISESPLYWGAKCPQEVPEKAVRSSLSHLC